ncbi:diadenosine tetraphosphate (Ap4A) HIT family hydrolase [Clostridium saccharoperbutylacetonicum]|uniref:Histidine triad (HIT) protein n=1 Tax=Clostridium saccharoperbutylacetonicum N1-4(HMT) TaxID=931276 RepID=M1N0M1_9CLOT|nr:HIT family protein [Clostridium saccharoperbutylacetonicum]AGF57107.1 histidine triad (HIT) protein [Clostridium saccharoperbutylacetonicum N1-4(HMT)]NRT62133.1 diadenosine tetraphosphate (Ap4A) HIT family hydrolase [Clostridium saccharoperbutylacetonicum]NSB25463.1 diadenosine tetraphosphate (Ap4A) HIT family hydrolase [Clostridium saccharoperbutylacetonicum]NSB44833.1 diadenosine tetraphosphate (Ap4A) HIT family hydrolase [Clostridium saccharoperbutylacetonicum]
MNFDEKCFYCSKNEELDKLMIKICDLEVSTVYLFKEQTYKGRCNVVFKEHKSEVAELTEQEASSFIKDVRRVAQAIHKAFTPNKINYGAFADTMKHLHFHLVPKYEGGPSWGGTFEMNPQQVYLSDEEYNELIDKVKKNL